MYKAIIFDVDDTLYNQQTPFENALLKTFPQLAEKLDMEQAFIRFRHHSDVHFSEETSGKITLAELHEIRLNETLLDFSLPAIGKNETAAFQIAYVAKLKQIQLQPEMREALEFLAHRKFPMGVITNGPADHQQKKITQLGITRWIPQEKCVISGATDYEKPQQQIFDLLREKFNFAPSELLYVGDSFLNDIIGAKSAGWDALWINTRRREMPKSSKILPNITCQHYSEVRDYLKSLPLIN